MEHPDNYSQFGYSQEHLSAMSKEKKDLQFKKHLMLKQNYTLNFCSPIHCAAINTNPELLSYIVRHLPDFSVGDSLNRKPIHYAATIDNTKNLDILVRAGGDLKDIDKRKMTCLMIAAQHGRIKVIRFLLEKIK